MLNVLVVLSRADQRELRWFGHLERMDKYRMCLDVLYTYTHTHTHTYTHIYIYSCIYIYIYVSSGSCLLYKWGLRKRFDG